MCLQHPCYESLNKFAASKSARIIYGILLVIAVSFGVFQLFRASNDMHATKNAKLASIPESDRLIRYRPDSPKKYVSEISKVRDSYSKKNLELKNCANQQPSKGEACAVDWAQFGPCGQEDFGYQRAQPCVYFKVKKFTDWMPKYINATSPPAGLPENLKDILYVQNAIWLNCEGLNPADVENIGPVAYYPKRSYPLYYFPYNGQENYLEPIVAVQFEQPRHGILIGVKCTLWTQDEQESVEFDLLIDSF